MDEPETSARFEADEIDWVTGGPIVGAQVLGIMVGEDDPAGTHELRIFADGRVVVSEIHELPTGNVLESR